MLVVDEFSSCFPGKCVLSRPATLVPIAMIESEDRNDAGLEGRGKAAGVLTAGAGS